MSKKSTKERVLSIPLVGYGLRVASNVLHAPAYHDNTTRTLDKLTGQLEHVQNQQQTLNENMADLSEKLSSLLLQTDNFQKQVELIKKTYAAKGSKAQPAKAEGSELFADNHLLDIFYTQFEDKFKNSEVTFELLDIYKDDFKKAKVDFKKYPVLDIGCGRGEFLEFMKQLKINARGVDINTDMVDRANKLGYKVEQGDALQYLQKVKAQSLGAVTGFHIVEHIPFPGLLEIFSAAYSSLAPDGFVLFETPNPENVIVASHSFYFDPSHLKPLPPELLAFTLESVGFRKVEIRRSYPVKKTNDTKLNPEVFKAFYGPRNYAVIGYK